MSRWSFVSSTLRTNPSRTRSATRSEIWLFGIVSSRPSSFIVMPGSRVTRSRTTTWRVNGGNPMSSARSRSSAFIIPFTSRRRSTTSEVLIVGVLGVTLTVIAAFRFAKTE